FPNEAVPTALALLSQDQRIHEATPFSPGVISEKSRSYSRCWKHPAGIMATIQRIRKRRRIRMNINDEYVTLTAPIFDTPVIYLDRTATNISSNYGEASCRILLPFHVCSQIHIDKYHCQTDLYVITLFRKYIGLPEQRPDSCDSTSQGDPKG